MNILKQADFFGVPFVQNINQQQTVFKSALGGFLSILLSILSLTYAFWVFYQWNNKQMSPKISNSKFVSDYSMLDFNSAEITIYYESYEGVIDPFKQRIFLPLVMYSDDFLLTEPIVIENYTESTFGQLYIPKLDLGYSYYDGYVQTSKQMYIFIAECQEKYLKPNEKCATNELKEEFFKQRFNYFGLQVKSTTLDSRDGSDQITIQDVYIEVEQESCYSINTFLQTNYYELEDYLLFGNSKIKEYISGANVQTQTLSSKKCQQIYQMEILATIYVTMNGTQTKTVFQYPQFGDLLANIGSIVSVLFLIKYIIIYLNQYSLSQQILNELINFYYPEFQKIQITKNWRRKIIKISFNQIEVDKEEYQKMYEKLKKQMQQKLSYMNLLYEISRLYLIIRSSKLRQELAKSHLIKIKLNLTYFKENDLASQIKSPSRTEPFLLNDDDAELLSLERRRYIKYLDNIPSEFDNEFDYYCLNKVY